MLLAPRLNQAASAPCERLNQFIVCVRLRPELVQTSMKNAELQFQNKASAPGAGDTDHHLVASRAFRPVEDGVAMVDHSRQH